MIACGYSLEFLENVDTTYILVLKGRKGTKNLEP